MDKINKLKINKLKINEDNIGVISSSMEDDLNYLINCENLFITVGTFGISAYLLSNNIKNLISYKPLKELGLMEFGYDPNTKLSII